MSDALSADPKQGASETVGAQLCQCEAAEQSFKLSAPLIRKENQGTVMQVDADGGLELELGTT